MPTRLHPVKRNSCVYCKKEFVPPWSRPHQQHCSKSCARYTESMKGIRRKKGRYTTKGGYINIWVGIGYPGALSNGYMPEHRKVMADHIGRPLTQQESVHHINGERDDNRIENLQLRARYHGKGTALQCWSCGSQDIRPVKLEGL